MMNYSQIFDGLFHINIPSSSLHCNLGPSLQGKYNTRKLQHLVSNSPVVASIYIMALCSQGSCQKMICWLMLVYTATGHRQTSFRPNLCLYWRERFTIYPDNDMQCRGIKINSFFPEICSIWPEEIVLLDYYRMDNYFSICQFLRDFLSAFLAKILNFPLGEDQNSWLIFIILSYGGFHHSQ